MECYDYNWGKHQANHRCVDDADNLDGLTVFIIVKSQSLKDGRETVAHVEPKDDEEDKVRDGNMRDLELFSGLLIEVEIAVNPTEFDEKEVHEM